MTFVDVCAGIGGFSLGLEWAGMTCKGQVEIDDWCNRVLAKHWPDVPRWGDVKTLDSATLGYADVFTFGDPCPKHSRARSNGASRHPDLAGYCLALVGRLRPRSAGRISELRELSWEDVDLERNTIRLWTSKRRGGDREPRTIALSPTLQEIFSRLHERRQPGDIHVFINPLTGVGYTRQSREIKNLFHNVCRKAEVPLFTAHSLRHYVATHFNDPRRAQIVLGHMNIRTTEIYLHELGVDRGVADIFEAITNQITNETKSTNKKGVTVLQ